MLRLCGLSDKSPQLLDKIDQAARESNKCAYEQFWTEQDLLKIARRGAFEIPDQNKPSEPPTIDEMMRVFEIFDTGMKGWIDADDLVRAASLKEKMFLSDKYDMKTAYQEWDAHVITESERAAMNELLLQFH